MNKFYADEAEYHQLVINSISSFPDELKSRPGLATLVWGHEIEMHDAGRGGGDGAADLLTLDEEGRVWLIEVKLSYNTELGAATWGQLARYKKAIQTMSWQRLLKYTKKFLLGCEKTKPEMVFPNSIQEFDDVLAIWQSRLGRQLIKPADLAARVADQLTTGTCGMMVLADVSRQDVISAGNCFTHDGPIASVQAVPTEFGGLKYFVRWCSYGSKFEPVTSSGIVDSRFDSWQSEVNQNCSPLTFAGTLSEGARRLWVETLEPGLVKLGWKPHIAKVKSKGFNVGFDIQQRHVELMSIGWADADSKRVARTNKLAGGASMKVQPQIVWLYRATKNLEFVNEVARRFYDCGWRGRRRYLHWGISPITEDELKSADGCMVYHPNDLVMDHNGRPGDRESLERLLDEFRVLRDQLTKMPLAS